MDRAGLARFLRAKRESLRPADVGLPAGGRRRTPGLRREEVARLAHISVDHYTRLEQSRGRRPSRQVLAGISGALRLSDVERAFVFEAAGERPDTPHGPPATVRPSLANFLRRLPDSAAIVLDATCEVIAWNPLATALLEDFSVRTAAERNLLRRFFLPAPGLRAYDGHGASGFGEFAVGNLRTAAARYPRDPRIAALVAELRAGSAEFIRRWEAPEIRRGPHLLKRVHHPAVGALELNCDALTVPDDDQHVVIFTGEPGSPTEERLRALACSALATASP